MKKPATIECRICGETIYEGEEWSSYEDVITHDTCSEKERREAAAAGRAGIKRIKAKQARGEELTFDELMTISSHELAEACEVEMLRQAGLQPLKDEP